MPEFNFEDRMNQAREADVSPARREARRVGYALRDLIERLTATSASVDDLAKAADAIEQLAGSLEGYPRGHVYGYAESSTAGDPYAHFDHSPIMGQANPIAPPLFLAVVDGKVEGHGRFGAAYEGPPGCVHGGHVAAAFDEVLGMTQSLAGNPGMTGRLIVHYRRPTPLYTDLRFVGTLDRVEGRKIFTTGYVYDGDTLTAEAEGLFISVNIAKMAALAVARDERAKQRSADVPQAEA